MGSPSPQLSRSVYGFVLVVCSLLGFTIYMAWALVPMKQWARIGIIYLPDKYWALALPSWVIVAVLTFAFCLYPGYILACSNPSSSLMVEDSITNYDVYSSLKDLDIEPLRDLRVSEVNRRLYRDRRK